jgi:hypothetical protein
MLTHILAFVLGACVGVTALSLFQVVKLGDDDLPEIDRDLLIGRGD